MKFALVTPRYGADIAHGPEHTCRHMAEELSERHEIEVLTTCASDARTWKNEYAEGVDRVLGVLVRRFPVSSGRDQAAFEAMTRRVTTGACSRADELQWLRASGSCSAALVEFLKRQHRNYDALVFFSGAGTTIQGLAVAPERSVLFPGAAIDDPVLRLGIWRDAVASAAAVGYGTGTERTIVRTYLGKHPRAEEVVGIGVAAVHEARYPRLRVEPAAEQAPDEELAAEHADNEQPPAHLSGRGVLFRRRHRLHGKLALYGGPVTGHNGIEELIEYFDSYAAQDGDTMLVLLGVKLMKLPAEPWLRSAGILPERDRIEALEAADVALAPDPDDLLGEYTLEAMATATPVLASALNAGAVEHVKRANGGLYYANREEFVEALSLLMSNDALRERLGQNGRRHVQQHYRWDAVIGRFERLISRVKAAR